MKYFSLLFVLLAACSQPEEEMEPDYDNMVMADEEEEWITDEERDRKVVLADPPDPQEILIIEPQE